jgi:PPP family 3-phenylpropionic acid transporter
VASTGLAGARALFFAYFAYVGLLSPYLSLWLDDRGLSIVEIALILSLPQWLRVVAPPFWGWLSDRTGRRVALLRFSAVAALVLTLGFPFAHGLMPIALLLLALSFVTAAQGPIGEVLALEQARGDVGGYGRIRLWGSIGFVATVLIGGPALDRLGVSALPWLMACALVVLVCVSLCVPEPAAALARAARTTSRSCSLALMLSCRSCSISKALLARWSRSWSRFVCDLARRADRALASRMDRGSPLHPLPEHPKQRRVAPE